MLRTQHAALDLQSLTETAPRPARTRLARRKSLPESSMDFSVSGCSGPSTAALDLQRLAEQRFGLRVLALVPVDARRDCVMDVSVSRDARDPRRRRWISRAWRIERLGLRDTCPLDVDDCQIDHGLQRVRDARDPTRGAGSPGSGCTSASACCVLALRSVDVCQIVHGPQRVGMLGTQHATPDLQGLDVECLGLRVLALFVVD